MESSASTQVGEEGRTREGYKDKQKRIAFEKMANCIEACSMSTRVLGDAKIRFTQFRKVREKVQDFESGAILAAVVVCAYRHFNKDGSAVKSQLQYKGINHGNAEENQKKLNRFYCPKCDQSFNSKKGLRFHSCSVAK